MHGPLNIEPLFAPAGYRNPTIQTVAAISRIALSIQKSTLIVSLTLNMSEHVFLKNIAFRWERMQHLTEQDWCLPTLHNPPIAFSEHYVIWTQ